MVSDLALDELAADISRAPTNATAGAMFVAIAINGRGLFVFCPLRPLGHCWKEGRGVSKNHGFLREIEVGDQLQTGFYIVLSLNLGAVSDY